MTKATPASLIEFDQTHLWHPYTSMTHPLPSYPVLSAQGVYLQLQNGQQLIDGMSSWWSTIHGYGHPALNAAAKQQIDQMAHVMFGGITHPPAVELGSLLLDITPQALDKIFFSDSGSVAVEVAIKMAIQYWVAQGAVKKSKLLTIRQGYHGDTFATMAVCDPETGMHNLFEQVLSKHFFADAPQCKFDDPWDPKDINSFSRIIEAQHKHIAAVILEPIVQGTGGMHFYNSEYLRQVRALCNNYDVLLIHDEIATGFARTGTLFAYEHADVVPDIMCVGKALTGGYMSLAATLTTEKIALGISQNGGVFNHGPTFMANPLACATACASIKLLLSMPWKNKIAEIEAQIKHELGRCSELPQVAEVRCLGAIGVVELKEKVNVAAVQKQLVEKGVWLRPFGKLIYMMPPYIIKPSQLGQINKAVYEVIQQA